MVGEIVHIELPSRDFSRSATFYAKLFGWKTDGVQSGGHLLVDLPGGVQASWIRDALAQAPGPVPFVAVSDVDKTLAEAEKQGGRILVQRMTLADRGVFGLIADCDGNVLGVIAARDGGSIK
ncbi:MAG: VOC family protein, partial [Myxococcales bacterium]